MSELKQKIIACDTESSALKPDQGQLLTLSMAAVDSQTGEIIERLELSIGNRGDIIPQAGAVAVNRINPLRHRGMPEAQAAGKVRDFLLKHGGSVAPFLGHNIEHDKKFIRNMLVRNGYDPTIVALKSIDTITEVARKIYKSDFPVEKLAIKTAWDGFSRPTLNQSSVAQALGISVDPAKAHSSASDMDVNIDIWRGLGRPEADDGIIFNNPYETESKLAGKIVRSKEWDGLRGEVVERSYYIVGGGTGEEEDAFGKVKYSGTAMICLDDGDKILLASDAVAEAEREVVRLAKEKTGGSLALSKRNEINELIDSISSEREFSSPTSFSVTIEDPSDERLETLLLLSPYVLKRLDEQRSSERERFQASLLAAAARGHFALKEPSNTTGIFEHGDNSLLPSLAAEMTKMTGEQRIAHVSALANSLTPPRGASWAHNMLVMAERYGYRSGLSGYEETRLRELKKQMPVKLDPILVSKGKEDVEPAFADAMAKKDVERIEMSCNGKDVFIKLFSAEGLCLNRRRLAVRENNRGQLSYPLAGDVAEVLSELTGAPRAAALKARSGFTAFYDRNSFEVVRQSFVQAVAKAEREGNEEGLKALTECLEDMGESYDSFIQASQPKFDLSNLAVNALGAPVEKKRGLENLKQYIDEAEALKAADIKAIREGYDGLPGFRLPAAADSVLIMAANLKNSRVGALKVLDAAVVNSGLQMHRVYDSAFNGSAALKMEPGYESEEQPEPKGKRKDKDREQEDPALKARCKVCLREVTGKNAVAGMGPTCARKLEDWLDRPEIGLSDITSGKFKRLSDIKDGAGLYPIMGVRDMKTGRIFAADIINKEKDGRYLVIDLSQISKNKSSGRRGAHLKECLKCYLDPSNHEVVRIFGSESNYYK